MIIGRVGMQMFHERISELEKRVAECEENLQALRAVLEVIREAVMQKLDSQ